MQLDLGAAHTKPQAISIQQQTGGSSCDFKFRVSSKYDDETLEASGPTLSTAITHALPQLRFLARRGAVLGVRRQGEFGRSHGCWEISFPKEGDRPASGYNELGVRTSVLFDDELEIFDVREKLKLAEDKLRFRAQDLGYDEHSTQVIVEGVREYVRAAYAALLWDPNAKIDLKGSLKKLFLNRDWTIFISPEELRTPDVTITDACLIEQTDKNTGIVRFHYVNGAESGDEIEFVDVKRGKLKVRRDWSSALRSAVPAFRGDQLRHVYEKLQVLIDQM